MTSVGEAEMGTETQPEEAGEVMLAFRSVSKRFALQHEKARSFQDLWIGFAHGRGAGSAELFWALRDLSLEVRRGEIAAVIGSNGSGKSTLLRIAARTMRPTSGEVLIRGKVAPLLDLAAGFQPALSGRDNIYLNGGILGLSRSLIDSRYDDIVSFAELEHFIDTPIRHYSSGMWLRLGFAIAAHTDADVMLIDEHLAVGDEHFQHKCLARIEELRASGKAILLVSHDLAQVSKLASHVTWLDQGTVRAAGPTREVVKQYLEASA